MVKGSVVQMVPELSPVGESQSNGDIGNAVEQVQGQFRTIPLIMQAKYKEKLPESHGISTVNNSGSFELKSLPRWT